MLLHSSYAIQTYRDFLARLQLMTDQQLDCSPAVYDPDSDEYYPVNKLYLATDTNQVLDEHVPYLSF